MLRGLTKTRRETLRIPASALQLTVLHISRIHCNIYFEWKSHSPRELPVEVYFTDKTTKSLYRITERSAWSGSWHNTMQYSLLLARLQTCLSQRSLQLSAVLCTLTEVSSTALRATLLHWIVSREVAIPFEVRVNFNNDFSEAKTLPRDPAKKSYFHLVTEVQTFLSSFRFWRQIKTGVPGTLGYFLLQPLDCIKWSTKHQLKLKLQRLLSLTHK